jgi:hypothetical protein
MTLRFRLSKGYKITTTSLTSTLSLRSLSLWQKPINKIHDTVVWCFEISSFPSSMTAPLLNSDKKTPTLVSDGSLSLLSHTQYSYPNLLKNRKYQPNGAVLVPKKKNKDNFKYELGHLSLRKNRRNENVIARLPLPLESRNLVSVFWKFPACTHTRRCPFSKTSN